MTAVLPLLYSATLFLSAFLMFAAEPMVARIVLPVFGGAPMVWNTCVLFFQLVLLFGYLTAHAATTWLGSRRQTIAYLALVAIPLAGQSAIFRPASPPATGSYPIAWLFVALTGLIGLPFFVLSLSASIVQKWFSGLNHPSARDLYFLYAASNVGSLLALVSYAAIFEPTLTLRNQAGFWVAGYALFMVLACLCAAAVWLSKGHDASALAEAAHAAGPGVADRTPADDVSPSLPLSRRRRIRWVFLAFVPSSLMLGLTTYLTTDIAAFPLLWIIPLAIYLMTFVLAFGTRAAFIRARIDRVTPVALLALAWTMIGQISMPLPILVPLHLITFALAALLCHADLAIDRPPARFLTEFYFWIALGGVLGGLFNTLVAPLVFRSVLEYALGLVLAAAARWTSVSGGNAGQRRQIPAAPERAVPKAVGVRHLIVVPGLVLALTAGTFVAGPWLAIPPIYRFAALALPLTMCFSQLRWPGRFAICLGALLLAGGVFGRQESRVLHAERTFFGVYRVVLDPDGRSRRLVNGTTLHGMQFTDPARQDQPLIYYHRTGPFGQAFAALPRASRAASIAVIGLGTGSLASYAQPGQRWTFYEIDPAVERLARTPEYFTHLQACGNRCQVVLGDARLSLARAQPGQYGMIVLDAFSSDAIPIHLLTNEAISLYRSRLEPGGALVFHISNRHLTLAPVLARLAVAQGWTAIWERERVLAGEATRTGKTSSDWMVMAAAAEDLGALAADKRWGKAMPGPGTPLWTDDFSSLFSVLGGR